VNSNWPSGLAVWDRLHGTFRLEVPQDAITIGVPECPAPGDVTLQRMLALPFVARNLNTGDRAERRPPETAPPDAR